MKRFLASALCFLLLLTGCSTPETKEEKPGISGTFTGSAMGMKSTIEVEVVLDNNSISAVNVISHGDTQGIADAAVNALPQILVETQNIEADNITGATMTSLGIKNAVKAALENSGVDVNSFKKGTTAAEKTAKEAESYDVVVVGSGMAGLSAAIDIARNSDLSVVVLEKNAYTGGSSRVCGGGIWAVNSELNKEIEMDSTKEEMIGFLKDHSEGAELNEALLSNIYDGAAEIIEYYYNNGLPVVLDTWSLGHPESKLPVLWSKYNKKYPWLVGENGLIDAVAAMAEKEGVEIRLNCKVMEINAEGDLVTGVQVEDQKNTYEINARKVILATGGFTRNPELIETYAPEYASGFAFTGAGSTGDGIVMTEKFGAQVVGEGMMGLTGYNANYGYYGSEGSLVRSPVIAVNAEGNDFGMKDVFYSETLKLLIDQPGNEGYGIYDSSNPDLIERLEDAVAKNVMTRYDSLEALAEGMKINAENLQKTVAEKGLGEAPYYGIVIRPLFIGSIPGLKVDAECRVLNGNDDPVENLFAAGELIFGNAFNGHYPASGTGVGISAYSGGVAAKAAVAELNQ